MSPDDAEAIATWASVLDDLETAAARAGREAPGAWAPPLGLGPLPIDLQPRAREVLALQHGARGRVDAELRDVTGQLGAVRAVGRSAAPERPVDLDVPG